MEVIRHTTCPACSSPKLSRAESIRPEILAARWHPEEPPLQEKFVSVCREVQEEVVIDRCGECGLEFGNPMFAVGADWYAVHELYGPRWEYNVALDNINKQVTFVIDVGCGEGHFLAAAEQHGRKASGIDFNAKAIEVARSQGLDATTGDLTAMAASQETGSSAVCFFHVLEHLTHPLEFLEDIKRNVPSVAEVWFSVPGPRRYCSELLPSIRAGNREMWDYPPFHQTRWNEKAAASLLKRAGFALTFFEEEPLHVRGVSVHILDTAKQLPENALQRKLAIAQKALSLLPAKNRLRGMSMLVGAKREDANP